MQSTLRTLPFILHCADLPVLTNPLCLVGVVVPAKMQAIGWRVAVYWPEESTLHDGEIIGFDNVSLRHHVRYDSGDHEHVSLDATKASCACSSLLISSELKAAPVSTALLSHRPVQGSVCSDTLWRCEPNVSGLVLSRIRAQGRLPSSWLAAKDCSSHTAVQARYVLVAILLC